MIELDELDYKILKENFDEGTINSINHDNATKIFEYLNNNGIYDVKALLLTFYDLFLLPYEEFIKKFEYLKIQLGPDYMNKISENISLIELMYN